MPKVALWLFIIKLLHLTFRFIFKIKLHREDRPLLEYLKTQYDMSRVYPILLKSNYQYFSSWEVVRQEEVLKLKEIFDMKPLNTSKYLDYL